jgi:hypothetical protein
LTVTWASRIVETLFFSAFRFDVTAILSTKFPETGLRARFFFARLTALAAAPHSRAMSRHLTTTTTITTTTLAVVRTVEPG